jgi:hypothetical protein
MAPGKKELNKHYLANTLTDSIKAKRFLQLLKQQQCYRVFKK